MADGSVIIDSKLDKSGLESGLASLGKFSSSAFGVIGKGIAAISGGLTAMGGFAMHAGMNFDTAMSQVAATMGKSVDEIQILSDKAKEMGESTKFSATEAAEALNYLALAGYDAATAADVLPSVLNLAAAGGMDLAYASDLATDAMSALGISASEANLTKFGDELAMTASKANTSVAQLGEAILTVGGTAKVLKGGTVELNTALGVLANRGIKGAEGGTHLRNVILALTAPTEKSAEAMKKLGVSATTSTGEMRPLNEVLGDLDAAMSNLTDAQKTEVLNTIFNKTDIAAVQGLIAGLGEEWNTLAGNIENAGGAMQKMADTQIDNLEGDITILKSALEGLGIAAYEGFRGPMRQIVQLGTQMIGDLTNAMKKGGYKQLSRALGDVVSRALTQVTGYLPKVVDLAVDVIEGLCDGLIDNAEELTEGLSSAVTTAIEGISRILPKVAEAGITIAVSLAQSLANELPTLIPKVIDGLVQTIVVLCQNAGQILQAGIAIAKALVDGIISAIPTLLNGVIDAIGGLWQSAVNWLKGKPAELKVDVNKKDADDKLASLKLDLQNLQDNGYNVNITASGDAMVELQTLQDADGNTVTIYAKCDPTGQVKGFVRTVNGIEVDDVEVSAVADDGSITLTQNSINGITAPECKITLGFDENGNPTTIQTSIDNIQGKSVDVTVNPTSINVPVTVDDVNEKIRTLSTDLDKAKKEYLKEAVKIETEYESVQGLIDELAEIQTSAGVTKVDLSGVGYYSTTLSSMAKSATTMSEKVSGFISASMKEETVNSFKEASTALSSIATSCTTLGSDLAGLSNATFPDPKDLGTAASDAETLAQKCTEAANLLTGLAGTNGLFEYKKNGLLGMAGDLTEMAGQAKTLASELGSLSGKEYLTEEDKTRIAEITQQLSSMYPELAKYIGEDGLIALEAKQIAALTEDYKNLALAKAASAYMETAGQALLDAQMQHEMLHQAVIDLEQQNAALQTARGEWEKTSQVAQEVGQYLAEGLWNQQYGDEFTADAEKVGQGTELIKNYLSSMGLPIDEAITRFQELTGVDLTGLLDIDTSTWLTPEQITSDSQALELLKNALMGVDQASKLELSQIDTQLATNETSIRDATQAWEDNKPVLEAAEAEYTRTCEVLNRATEASKELQKAQEGAGESAEQAGDKAAGAGEQFEESGKGIEEGGEAAKKGAENFAAANEEIKTTAENAEAGAEDVGKAAKDVTEKAKTISDASTSLTTAQTKAEEAAAAVKKAQEGITTDAATALTNAQNTANSIATLAGQMLETVKGVFTEDAIAAFAEYGKQIIEQIATGMETAATISTFTAAGTAVYNAVKGALEAALGANGSKFNAIGKSIVTGVATGMSNAATKAAFSSAAGKVKNAAYNALSDEVGANGSNFKAIGKNICTGVAAGIDSNSGSIASAARRAARAAYSAAMDEIDAHSPSKLFRRTVGKYISQGMALGIEDGIPDIEGSVGKAVDSISGLDDLDLAFSAADQMRALAASRNTAVSDESYADNSTDVNELAQAIWDNVPEDFAVNQTVNFNYPMQAPDEVARAIRDQNTYGLVGVRR